MSLNKKSVDDINVKGKRVLVRCDFNVPLKDGVITDESKMVVKLFFAHILAKLKTAPTKANL